MSKNIIYGIISIVAGCIFYFYISNFLVSLAFSVIVFVLLNYFDSTNRYYRLASIAISYFAIGKSFEFLYESPDGLNAKFSLFEDDPMFYIGLSSVIIICLALDFFERNDFNFPKRINLFSSRKNVFNNKGTTNYVEGDADINMNKDE
ncbi:hypothetical protein [Neolewinella antarctica]|uniref:Uncharacterized protein n=1 Tax=Neolewinella antarctica TaxID=442734 RepID=A0ABX0XGK3_9BACT|nr:hypothetical protein [Neolewinella antarctica]NJC28011.1 hypothetical protein [Neolewinella antarctica]